MRKIKREMVYNRKTIDTEHAIEQGYGRYYRNDYDWQEFQKKLAWIIQNAKNSIVYDYNDKSADYVVHSKSTGIGVVIDWREDTVNPDGKNHAIIVTVLPRKKKHFAKDPEDILLIVENQLVQWACNHIQETKGRKVKIIESEDKGWYEKAQIKLENNRYRRNNRFMVHLVNGKFVSTSAKIIIVD